MHFKAQYSIFREYELALFYQPLTRFIKWFTHDSLFCVLGILVEIIIPFYRR